MEERKSLKSGSLLIVYGQLYFNLRGPPEEWPGPGVASGNRVGAGLRAAGRGPRAGLTPSAGPRSAPRRTSSRPGASPSRPAGATPPRLHGRPPAGLWPAPPRPSALAGRPTGARPYAGRGLWRHTAPAAWRPGGGKGVLGRSSSHSPSRKKTGKT